MRYRIVLALLALCAAPAAAQQAGGIDGRAVSSNGDPVQGAIVQLIGTDLETTTDANGRFSFSSLRPGTYRLLIRRIGYDAVRQPVVVHTGAAADVRVTLAVRAIELEGLAVIGSHRELEETRQRMREIPGSVTLIESRDLRSTRQANFDDVFDLTPGVYAAPRFGAADETQFSIRGSGLRNNFHLRGVNLLVNGMPYRNADGFTDFESLELLTTQNVQVYKGGNALRWGGSTLGGAVNFETKTGYTSSPLETHAQGGAYGFFKGQAASGGVYDRFNYYASYTRTQLDGYRTWSTQRRDRVNAHLGYALSPRIDLRTFYFYAYIEEDLPGALTRDQFLTSPDQAHPNNLDNRFGRDISLHHVGVQLRTQLSPTQRLDIAPYGQFRDLVHPIFRVLDQTSRDYGTEIRYENAGEVAGRRSRFTLGVQPAYGENENRHFENNGGESGNLAKDQLDKAASFAVYAEELLGVTGRLSVVAGIRVDRSLREIEDFFLSDGDQTDRRWFTGVNPKAGLLVDVPAVAGQVYANASRSYEPPLLLELNSFTVPGFIDLDAQQAWQFEVGSRGSAGWLSWDVSVYDIELTDEIINLNVQPFPGAPFTVPTYRNVARSRHLGLEAGAEVRLPFTILTPLNGGDRITLRGAYTLADYAFVNDSTFGNNDLPGLPKSVLNAQLQYRHPVGLSVRPSVEWVPGSYFVNSSNTARNTGWTVLNVRAEWLLARLGGTVFAEVRNLTDELYSPAVVVDNAAGRSFLPADRRAFYGGVRWQL